ERNSWKIAGAMRFLVNVSVVSASSTRRPLIRSNTSRAFCGDTLVNRAFAVNSMSFPQRLRNASLLRLLLRSRGPALTPHSPALLAYYLLGGGVPAAGAAGVIAPGPPGMPAGLAVTSAAAFIECPL